MHTTPSTATACASRKSESGLRAPDGVVDYIGDGMIAETDKGQGDRGQSYSYAAASHGDWVYIGAMYGGLGVQAILSHGMAVQHGHVR